MGMIFTTGTGALVKPEDPELGFQYIVETDHPLSDSSVYSTSGMTVHDIMSEIGIEAAQLSGQSWLLDEIEPKIDALLASPDNDGDYPFAQATKVRDVIKIGRSLGATHLLIE